MIIEKIGIVEKIGELQKKRAAIEMGGGVDKIEKQHEAGKRTARQRLALLFDEGTFIEIDAFVTHRSSELNMPNVQAPCEGVITGYGAVNGRLVYGYSQDFTVIGGSLGEMHAAKICKIMDLAVKTGAPIVGLNDSGGARIQEGIDALKGFGDIFRRNTLASGVVPQIAVILGPCAGGAVYSPAICDFIFMVKKIGKMFITGPQVIKSVTGEDIDMEELGGIKAHAEKSGVVHFVAEDEEHCFADIRKLIDLLPANNLESAPLEKCDESINKLSDGLLSVIPDDANRAYDVKVVIKEIVDMGDFFEVHKDFACNIVVGFAKLNGMTVGIVANQPNFMAGALDVDSSDKAARFVRFCDSFNISIVSFTDVPGYLPGLGQEHSGIIRHGAKLLYAFSEATVPKINVILRKAYGGAYIAMNSKHLGADFVFAWPSAEIAVMGPEGAANIIFRKEIAASGDPIVVRKEKITEYKEKFANPYVAAARGYVDDVINPMETRPRIISGLEALRGKREGRLSKKHGNVPL